VRRRYEIPLADQVDVPELPNKSILVLLRGLPHTRLHILVVNLSGADVMGGVRRTGFVPVRP
jgi:hypothetical protein